MSAPTFLPPVIRSYSSRWHLFKEQKEGTTAGGGPAAPALLPILPPLRSPAATVAESAEPLPLAEGDPTRKMTVLGSGKFSGDTCSNQASILGKSRSI